MSRDKSESKEQTSLPRWNKKLDVVLRLDESGLKRTMTYKAGGSCENAARMM